MQAMRLSRKARWVVPTVAVVVTGGAIAASGMTIASAAPDLPVKTPAQLLADLASTQQIPALTGTVVETVNLGLPKLPQVGNPTSLTSLLTGSHTVKVYWQDGKHFRLAMPDTMSETDLVRNGTTLWLWESQANSVTKFSLAGDGAKAGQGGNAAKVRKAAAQAEANPKGPALPQTPQQAASDALAAVGPTTVVSVESTLTVAGEPAYQLVLAPKDSRSTIGSVRIAIDGKTSVPLRVQVFAKGASSPAFQVGYTDIEYVTPDPANFNFTPPPGATFNDMTKPQAPGTAPKEPALTGTFGRYGKDWLTVAEVPQSLLTMARSDITSSGAPSSPSSSSGSGVFSGDTQMAINALLGVGRPVSGPWGSGQLIHTSLINVLIVGNEMYIGAVEPSVLYAAVGHATPVNSGSAGNS
jgi:outer membrane lipoprotein-sorting protein